MEAYIEGKGVIYILTNPSFKEYVKIGYADNMENRLKQLNNSECTPFAFRVYATYEVDNRLTDLKLHNLIDKLNPSLRSIDTVDGKKRVREFYAMSPEDAFELLEAIAEIHGYKDRLKLWELSKEEKAAEEIASDIAIKSESETQKKRREYWDAFNEYAYQSQKYSSQFKKVKPSADHWMSLAIGSSRVHINLLQERNRYAVGVELLISDKKLFRAINEQKNEIEAELGESFNWMELPDKKTSRIVSEKNVNFSEREEWKSQFDWLMNISLKLKDIVKRYL